MGYGNLTSWTKNVEFNQVVQPGFISVVFKNNDLLSRVAQKTQLGGSAFEWRVNVSAATAEVFTEGQALPDAQAQLYVMATMPFIYYRIPIRISGHARDAMRAEGLPEQFNAIAQEFMLGAEDVRDLINTTCLGTGANGLQLAIDSTGTYANINRSTYSQWGSFEANLGGAATYAALIDLLEAVYDAERGIECNFIFAAPNQVTNIQSIPGAPGASNSSIQINLDQSGGNLRMGPNRHGTMVQAAELIPMRDLTNTVWLAGHTSHLQYTIHRDMEIRTLAPSGDDDLWQLSTAGVMSYLNTRQAGKETGVTA